MLFIIIPTYQAETGLARLLPQLAGARVIVSDGGSTDSTLQRAADAGANLAVGASRRGAQLKLGAKMASLSGTEEDWFLFLHADSQLPEDWQRVVDRAMQQGSPRYFRFKAAATGWRAMRSKCAISSRMFCTPTRRMVSANSASTVIDVSDSLCS